MAKGKGSGDADEAGTSDSVPSLTGRDLASASDGPSGSLGFPLVGGRDLSFEMGSARPPAKWDLQWDAIFRFRAEHEAPVDTMGCERLWRPEDPPHVRRFQILVSLMLSPQSKDEKTKQSMDNLYAAGPLTPASIVAFAQEDLEQLIKPSGLYRGKAKALLKTSQMLIDKHQSDVPRTMKELTALAGIGPKIAALALSGKRGEQEMEMSFLIQNLIILAFIACWQQSDAIGCDIHVTRIAQRLGWAQGGWKAERDAESVRHDLEDWLPKSLWRPINYGLVGFGQTVCGARPRCAECPAKELCPSAGRMPQGTPVLKRKQSKQ